MDGSRKSFTRRFRAAVRAEYRTGGAVYFIRQGDFAATETP